MAWGYMGWSPDSLLVLLSLEDGMNSMSSSCPLEISWFCCIARIISLLGIFIFLGVPSCQTQCKGLLERLFAKDEELEMPTFCCSHFSCPIFVIFH